MVYVLRLIWRLLSTYLSLWVNWVKRHLIRVNSFWDTQETWILGLEKAVKAKELGLLISQLLNSATVLLRPFGMIDGLL